MTDIVVYMKVLVYDFETSDSRKICAFGGLAYDTTTTECVEFSHLVQIVGSMGWRSSKVHGLSKHKCSTGMKPQDAVSMLYRYTKAADIVVVHNFSCEANALAQHLKLDEHLDKFLLKGYFDTHRFAKSHGYNNTNLVELWKQIYGDVQHGYGEAHDPLVDAKLTADIFDYFRSEYPEAEIMRGVIKPKVSRVVGVTYLYDKCKWMAANKSFLTKEDAETYMLQNHVLRSKATITL